MSSISQADLDSMNDSSKKEIANFLDAENSKQRVQMQIHDFTNSCFKNCVSSITSPELSTQEEQCLNSCVNRFLDANIRIVQNLQNVQ
ncbi:similar to Saccharomyces cerevisiae YJR135W-A TIM8 Mitochondrial intermembrane space protein [Maudiozyma saulgeensis]|uniref:Mitochondrial import inner membrane translocase subunit n=1 Tax=Maudiozyma saulgeensis TaxID=1789683 RepID=A0A1X7R957_9SACH|nr:similar to Saccharomyces cerevisiae YJR135W-A TIM8 Mitochondrial intermembrane space protein [Kazachstania saulgeensis]